MANPTVVEVEEGELEGGEGTTKSGFKYVFFKGIPYAEPPVGVLRFKSPVPIKPWTGRKNATKEGNRCSQVSMLQAGKIIGEEDCLFLNVYTPSLPKKTSNTLYPVMAFIHGGGFRVGSGDMEEINPELLVEKDSIVVTMNYRLGALGFLCLDSQEVPGNAGLRDQTLALTWINNNIRKFNGDPNNVTIFGGSAGSASVEFQMISPLSKGLFHKAILQSGSTLNPWTTNKNPARLVQKLSIALGITAIDNAELLKKLQEASIEDLVSTAYKVIDDEAIKSGELFGYAPVVEKSIDGVQAFLAKKPEDVLKSGNFAKVPTMIGLCTNEGAIFKMFYGKHLQNIKNKMYADYMTSFKISDKEKLNEKMTKVYSENGQTETQQIDRFLSDLLFTAGIHQSIRYYCQHGIRCYGYVFSYEGNFKIDMPIMNDFGGDGTLHAAEWAYLSQSALVDENKGTPTDQNTRRQLLEMWTNFAKFSNPTPDQSNSSLPTWNTITNDKFEILDINNHLMMKSFPWTERIDLWQELIG